MSIPTHNWKLILPNNFFVGEKIDFILDLFEKWRESEKPFFFKEKFTKLSQIFSEVKKYSPEIAPFEDLTFILFHHYMKHYVEEAKRQLSLTNEMLQDFDVFDRLYQHMKYVETEKCWSALMDFKF